MKNILSRVKSLLDQGFAILNSVAHYTCPASGLRIIVSNGIPDHDITLSNPNPPCAFPWMVKIPLVSSFSGVTLEPGATGLIGMSLNGVPAFGRSRGRWNQR